MRAWLAALVLALAPGLAFAQEWGFIDPLLAQTLDVRPGDPGPILFPDHADPSVATRALGIHYPPSRTGGNAVGINVGVFMRTDAGWAFAGLVDGVFGLGPKDPAFTSTHIEITTLTLGPGEPRCCPTQETRWSVDASTLEARRLQQ